MLTNKVYDIFKFVAQYVLPAAATLYFGLAKIWGLPYSEQVVGTILAVDAFIGAILGISLMKYNRQTGMAEVSTSGESSNYFLAMSNSAYDIFYWVVQVVLPAVGTLYFALSSLWAFPYGDQIVGTIALLDAFLGIFLGINTSQYNKAIAA